ncbi:MAG: TldD/PmbA family protein [Armatimonadota bacterium]
MHRIIKAALDQGADFADLRITDSTATSIAVQDGQADRISSAHSGGAGLRVLVDGAWGFAPTNRPDEKELLRCVNDAVEMAKASSSHVTDPGMIATVEPVVDSVQTEVRINPDDVPLADRVERVAAMEAAAREYDRDHTANTVATYADGTGTTHLANSFGTFLTFTGSAVKIGLSMVATDGRTRQRSSWHKANRTGYELIADLDVEAQGEETAKKAVDLLSAEQAPAGRFDVIIDPKICGLLVHEAFGHNSEADAVWSGNSILAGKMGEQVAADTITIIDDPTLPDLNGSYTYDHEGVPAGRHVIVSDGVLEGYLHSLQTAARFGVEPNGSARASGHQNTPIVRMSNTYIEPGEATLEEMIADIEDGIYLTGGYWGYVFTAKGQFTCNVEHAYAIENGELTTHYRNVSISGETLDTLRKVVAVGSDRQFQLGGTCGKNGQSMAVDAGGPHLMITDVVVGGQTAQ